jgi:hypothetical protein
LWKGKKRKVFEGKGIFDFVLLGKRAASLSLEETEGLLAPVPIIRNRRFLIIRKKG